MVVSASGSLGAKCMSLVPDRFPGEVFGWDRCLVTQATPNHALPIGTTPMHSSQALSMLMQVWTAMWLSNQVTKTQHSVDGASYLRR